MKDTQITKYGFLDIMSIMAERVDLQDNQWVVLQCIRAEHKAWKTNAAVFVCRR